MATTTKNTGGLGTNGSFDRRRKARTGAYRGRSSGPVQGSRGSSRPTPDIRIAGTPVQQSQPEEDDSFYSGGDGAEEPDQDSFSTPNISEAENGHNAPLVGGDAAGAEKPVPKKAFDGDQIANKEGAEAAPADTAQAGEPKSDGFYTGKALGAAMNAAPMGRVARAVFVARKNKVKAGGIGGTIFVLLFVGFAFFSSGLEAINVKENFANFGNANANFSTKNRMARSTAKVLSAFTESGRRSAKAAAILNNTSKMNGAKFISKLEKSGFTVTRAPDGSVSTLSKRLPDGTTATLNYASQNFAEESGRFARNIDVVSSLERANSSKIGRWVGPNGKNFLNTRLQTSLDSIVNRTKSDPQKTRAENARQSAIDLSSPESEVTSGVGRNGTNATDVDEDGVVRDADTGQPIDPASTPTELDTIINDTADISADTANDIEKAALSSTATSTEGMAQDLGKAMQGAGGGALASKALSGLNYLEWVSMGCTAVGTIQYIASVRNVLFTIELARFAYRYLNAAETQKAGIVVNDGLSLMLSFMRTGGGAYTSAGGLRYAMGDRSALVDEESRSKFSGGRENTGAFGQADTFLSGLPGFNSSARTSTCKVANNGYFQLGATAVSVGITVISFGTAGAASVSANQILVGGIQAALQIVIAVSGPRLAQAGKHLMIADLKNSFQKGQGLGAGLGAVESMNTSAHSLLITEKSVAPALGQAAMEDYKYEMKQKSFTERYLSLTNGQSLLATAAIKSSGSIAAAIKAPFSIPKNTLSLAVQGINGGGVYAANEQCQDPELKDYVTTPFCFSENSIAPDLDIESTYDLLLESGDINTNGDPVSDRFKSFIERCASGQPTLVYNTDVSTDGSDTSTISDCTDDSVSLQGETTTVAEAYGYIYNNQPKQSFIAKLFGARTYAQTGDASLVSVRQRMAAWQGYLVDKNILIDNSSDEPIDLSQPNSNNNNVFILGDSLTVGMQNTDASRNYLASQLTAAGWNPTVNAQGCRGVYQPSGPIAGDGASCPAGTIVDGLTVVNDPANRPALTGSGTVLIMLGTNGYETDINEFRTKAEELIAAVRSASPEARIVWLNVRLRTNGAKQNNYNEVIASIANENEVDVLDWNTYVTSANGDADTTNNVTWPANDGTHHDLNGYRQKTAYIVRSLGPPPTTSSGPGVSGPVDCSAAIGNQKIICAALQYQGIRYAFTEPARLNQNYGTNFPAGRDLPAMMRGGANASNWLRTRVVGSTNDFVECSGFTNLSLWVAHGYQTTAGCSGYYVVDNNNDGYSDVDRNLRIIPLDQIQPGDFLTVSKTCQTADSSGHIAIFVSMTADGKYRTLESSAGRNVNGEKLSGYYERDPNGATAFKYAARYVGPGSGQ